jgi:hypothetical protein
VRDLLDHTPRIGCFLLAGIICLRRHSDRAAAFFDDWQATRGVPRRHAQRLIEACCGSIATTSVEAMSPTLVEPGFLPLATTRVAIRPSVSTPKTCSPPATGGEPTCCPRSFAASAIVVDRSTFVARELVVSLTVFVIAPSIQ